MKNVLITGAGARSFIGRNLKESFAERFCVFAPPHTELDLLDFEALARYTLQNRIDVIVHAAVHVPMFNGVEKEYYNDMRMFLNIEKLSREVEKVIYFGSGAEYDKRYDITLASETNIGKSIPVSEYGLAKYTMNAIARKSDNVYNLRLFGVFGKYELWEIKFLSNLCCKALFGLPLTVRRECNFDFLFIDDLIKAVAFFINGGDFRFRDYNLCSGRPHTLTELAGIVAKASGKPLEIKVLNEGQDNDYTGCNRRLLDELTDFSPTSAETGISRLYEYYNEHKDEINIEVLKNSH